MALPVFDPSKPFEAVEGETLDTLVPSVRAPVVQAPAAPTFDPSKPFQPVPEPAAVSGAPVFDPAKPFTPAPEPAPGVYTLDTFSAKTPEELIADKNFSPVQFGARYLSKGEGTPEQIEKLRQVYVAKEAAGTTALEKAKATFSGVLPALKTIAGGVEQTAKTAQKFSPQGIADALQRVVKGESVSDVTAEFVKAAAEVPASVEASAVGTFDLLRRSSRAIQEAPLPVRAALLGPVGVVAGSEPVGIQTEQKSRQRLFNDIEGLKVAERAGQGNGEVMKAVGADAETLKSAGIILDPEAIAKLSVVTDPINYIPVGGAINAVSKVGGAALRIGLATATTAEQAAKLAKILNSATEAVAKAKSVTSSVAGSAAESVGSAVEGVGKAAQKGVRSLGGTASGVGLGGIIGGDIYSALGGAAVAKTVPKGIQAVGRGIKATGEILSGTRAVPAGLSLVGDAAKAGIAGAAKGIAEGAVISLPFELGARPEEEEQILGMVGLGGAIRGGLEGGHPAVRAAGTAAQNKLAESIFRRVEQTDAPESATYGTEPALDTAHSAAVAALPPQSQKLVNWGRELLREAGGEIYALPNEEFVKAAGDGGLGYAVNIGEKLAPDGSSTPLVRIFLNASSEALPHEFFHALESIDPVQADALRKAVQSEWTKPQKEFFERYYNTLRNRGLPENQWRHRLTDEQVATEAGAEVFSRLFLAQDLTGISPSITQKAALFASSLIDKLGSPLAAVGRKPGEAGVSTLGVRPGVESTKVGQAWIANLLQRVNETSSLGEAPKQSKAFEGLTPKDISNKLISKKPPGAPPSTPPTPPPAPPVAPPPTTPVTPAPAPVPTPPPSGSRNIRTTRAAQDDFAGRRAEQTGTVKAREVAKSSADPNTIEHVNQISDLIESGAPVVEIEHSGIIAEGSAQKPSGRGARRAEQEAAYIAEGLGAAPESVRNTYQKTFVPVRWETVAGKPQLLAMSLDKVIANTHKVANEASLRGRGDLVPYEISAGKLTEAGWNAFTQDLRDYAANQQNGFRGDGQKLIRPTTDIGLSIPAENPGYNPVRLDEAKANFLNVVQGLAPPLTAREGSNLAKAVPGNVKGQILAEVNARTPEKPAVIRPEDVAKQNFKSQPGRSVMETNPLRNQLAEAGVPVRELIEVTERINAESINKVTPRPDLDFSAPVTDTIRGGFLPKLVPVLETTTGEIYPGKSHSDAMARALSDRQAGKITPEQFGDVAEAMMTDNQHKFLDLDSGKVLNRADAGKAIGSGELQSEHLPPAEVAANLETYLKGKPEGAFLPAPTFYSELQRVIEDRVRGDSIPAANIAGLVRNAGIKAEELKWSGLDEYLAGKERVSVPELKKFLAENAVQLEEVIKGDVGTWTVADSQRLDRLEELNRSAGLSETESSERQALITRENAASEPGGSPALTKFDNYQVPGGENYRELLLTLPERRPVQYDLQNLKWNQEESASRDGGRYWIIDAPGQTFQLPKSKFETAREGINYLIENKQPPLDRTKNFKSSHFDEPNVLAHVRFNERRDSGGGRTLFLEEVQSDWHQAGKRKGYAGSQSKAATAEFVKDEGWVVYDAEGKRMMSLGYDSSTPVESILKAADKLISEKVVAPYGTLVPDAPFRKTWPLLAVKRMIRYAAENGFDSVAWTTGETQAARYDLSKHISELRVSKLKDGQVGLDALGPAPEYRLVISQSVSPDRVADFVGKDLAEEIAAQKENYHEYSDLDLAIGGEGMRGFYDQILPKEVGAYVKRWGAKVQKVDLSQNHDAWSVALTPSMKSDVMKTGQKMFLPGVETDNARKAGFLPDPKPADRTPSEAIRNIAKGYAVTAGLDYQPSHSYSEVNSDLAKRLADFYDSAQHNPDDPAVQASYQALADETMAQYRALKDAGYVIEPFTGEGEPYKSSADAVADARDNKHLFFLKTTADVNFSGKLNNPMLRPSGERELSINDVFRGVHDFFGHAKEGFQFGPRGEFNAWKAHSEMFSEAAQGALAAETLAQNSWVNYGKHLRDEAGNIATKGSPEFVPLTERPFAEQKAIVVPAELITEAQGKFLPTGREYEARREEERLKPTPKKAAKRESTTNPTAWILPDGEVKPLTTSLHENDLTTNRADYAERFGTDFSDKPNIEDRLKALNAGFVRMRLRPDGSMTVEIGADSLGKQRSKLADALLANADKIDKLRIAVLDRKGNVVDSFDNNQVFLADDRGAVLEAGVDALRNTKSAPKKSLGPGVITRARQLGVTGDFLPRYVGEITAESVRANKEPLATASPNERAALKGVPNLPEKSIVKSPFSVDGLGSSDLPKFLPRFISAPDRIPDVLDGIYELGGITSPRKSKYPKGGEYDGYNEAFGSGIARLLRRYNSGRGLAPDELRDSLVVNYGFRKLESTSDLYDMVSRASQRRKAAGQIRVAAWEDENPF